MSVIEITEQNIKPIIEQEGTVILDFWAPWCGPCKSFAPIFEKASEKHGEVTFGKINTEQEQALAGSFGIRSIPTTMVFRDGILLFNQAGMLPASALDEILEKTMELDMDQVRNDIAAQQAKTA